MRACLSVVNCSSLWAAKKEIRKFVKNCIFRLFTLWIGLAFHFIFFSVVYNWINHASFKFLTIYIFMLPIIIIKVLVLKILDEQNYYYYYYHITLHNITLHIITQHIWLQDTMADITSIEHSLLFVDFEETVSINQFFVFWVWWFKCQTSDRVPKINALFIQTLQLILKINFNKNLRANP